MTKNKVILFLSSDEFYPQFEVALDSVFKHEPDADVWLLYFNTDPDRGFDATRRIHDPRVRLVHPWEIIPNPNTDYPIADFIASHRAAFILRALADYEKVLLLGSDCVVYKPISLWDWLGDSAYQDETPWALHDMLLTPHITKPFPDDGLHPDHEDMLHVGQMNVDVMAFRRCSDVISFLQWVHLMLQKYCLRDKTRNLFSDQTWFNFAFSMVPYCGAISYSAVNVAYWNVLQRDLQLQTRPYQTEPEWFVDGGALLEIFQFSGMCWEDPAQMSVHQNRYRAEGDVLKIYTDYVEAVNAKRS